MSDIESHFDVEDPGAEVLRVATQATSDLIVFAPFIKVEALAQVINGTSPAVKLKVVTRWHLTEIAAGVSDLDVWPLLRDRGGELRLRRRLHAKMFVSDIEALAGSANVTGAGLGWSRDPNDEIILQVRDADEGSIRAYADRLWNESVPVDDQLHSLFTEQVGDIPKLPEAPLAPAENSWTPVSRDPADVIAFYRGKTNQLTGGAIAAARYDLAALETPKGLSQESLHIHISLQLLQHPLVKALEDGLRTNQRFGVALGIVREIGGQSREEAAVTLQTMIRWLLFFHADRWSYQKANYSEIFRFVG